MSTVLLRVARVIEILSVVVLIVGLVLAPPDSSFADDEYNAGCTNGGGGKAECKLNTAQDECSNGTTSKQCDTAVTCTCKLATSNPKCRCGS